MSKQEAVCVIPARLESTRLPKKMLQVIDGKPLLRFVYENAKKAKKINRVVVACDHESIKACVESFGGEAVLTRRDHQSGTERVAEVAMNTNSEIFVNLQGYEPMMNAEVIDQVVTALQRDISCVMSTACISKDDPVEYANPNVVKVVTDQKGWALYFSRSPIPHDRDQKSTRFLKHLGIYGYRRDFLIHFATLPPSLLEKREKLEQLRALDHGYRIKVVETIHDSIGVDTEDDLKQVSEKLGQMRKVGASHA